MSVYPENRKDFRTVGAKQSKQREPADSNNYCCHYYADTPLVEGLLCVKHWVRIGTCVGGRIGGWVSKSSDGRGRPGNELE